MNAETAHRFECTTLFLEAFAFRFGNELDLQDDLEKALVQEGYQYIREFRLETGPIDFLVAGGIGIECKVEGGPSAVLGQLMRYAAAPELDGLILVTSRHTHRFSIRELNKKPFRVVWVAGRAL